MQKRFKKIGFRISDTDDLTGEMGDWGLSRRARCRAGMSAEPDVGLGYRLPLLYRMRSFQRAYARRPTFRGSSTGI